MNSVAVELKAIANAGFIALSAMTLSELNKEVSHLRHLRAEARRLNEAAFRDALAEAEAKAPALVPNNGLMRFSEIEAERADIEEVSRVVGPEVFTLLTDRILLLKGEIGRRHAMSRSAA